MNVSSCARTLGLAFAFSLVPAFGVSQDFEIPPNSTLTLNEPGIVWHQLTLNDKSVINFDPHLGTVQITVEKLVLKGNSEIDLYPNVPTPDKASTGASRGQAGNNPAPQNGERGGDGSLGAPGTNGIGLTFNIKQVDYTHGALWIRTDGSPGGAGGDGGNGGKGSSGPHTCTSNPNGGNGGAGGNGGNGGRGGDVSKVTLTLGSQTITPLNAPGVSPSARPALANNPGTIVVSGAPGAGGPGGVGGNGGPGGEGHENHFPCTATDSSSGSGGPHGANGATGANGSPAQ
ncbi:MAG: hypothetical protein ABR865_03120 [Terracidiphilus sp.]|jgi:hypothetical protein